MWAQGDIFSLAWNDTGEMRYIYEVYTLNVSGAPAIWHWNGTVYLSSSM